jgi:hypothetical protein
MDRAKQLREELEVEVFVENTIGRAFYAEYGFQPMATTKLNAVWVDLDSFDLKPSLEPRSRPHRCRR